MSDSASLTCALEGWYDTLLRDLPEAVRQRVEQDFFPLPWNNFSAAKRLRAALLFDWQHDPATRQDQLRWRKYFERKSSHEKQISQWQLIATPTAGDMALKETRLEALLQELAHIEKHPLQARGDYYPELRLLDDDISAPAPLPRYINYPETMRLLAGQLHATPYEVAAWIWMGPQDGGLAAYLNADDLDSPPRFIFNIDHLNEFDYLSPLMDCWFMKDDITNFDPEDRYITGKALIERWSKQPDIQPDAFIMAAIADFRLLDAHPICGCTQGTFPHDKTLPPLTSSLFLVWQVLEIEADEFEEKADGTENMAECRSKLIGHLNHDQEMQARANQIAASHISTTGRQITRNKVATILARELGMDEATVLRRIRKGWK